MAVKRVLVHYGAFNPPTIGHTAALAHARSIVRDVSKVKMVPCGNGNPWKPMVDLNHRVAMCQLATKDTAVDVEPFEKEWRGHKSVLEIYRSLCPKQRVSCFVGSDKVAELAYWEHQEDAYTMMKEFEVVCLPRDGTTEGDVRRRLSNIFPILGQSNFTVLPSLGEIEKISSTTVRELIRDEDDQWKELVDPSVAEYIETHGLYRDKD